MGIVKVTPQEKIDEYFNSDALSQSLLKKLLGGIGAYKSAQEEEKTLYYEEKGHFLIGSAVDMLLTGEEGQFEKTYYVSDITKKPSDTEMSIINWVFDDVLKIIEDEKVTNKIFNLEDKVTINNLIDYPGSLEAAIGEHDWYGGKPGEKRITGLIERCTDYFEDLKKGVGKQILTAPDKKLIDDIVFSLKSNPRTEKFFNRKQIERTENITVYYQLPIYFYYRNIYCKALLDLLVVITDNEGNITSVQPFDLKTMNGSTLKFMSSLKSFGYHIQAAWYVEALLSVHSNFELENKITASFLKPFTFIVESNSFPGQPLLYEVDEEIMHIGKYGKKDLLVKTPAHDYEQLVSKGTKGFDELIDTYIYQTDNDWKEEKVITDNNGVLKIGWNGIKE